MKPPPFAYLRAGSVDEALAVLAQHGDEVSPLAGGQSLVPMMNFRLARPAVLLDLNRLPALDHVRVHEQQLHLGAMTRQSTVERSPGVARRWPLLPWALAHVGHPQIRNRGTVGGSLAHADPAAELPCVALAYDATVRLRSARGERELPVREFVRGQLTTAREPDELLVEVRLPAVPAGSGQAFEEFARRHGDFAYAGVAVVLAREGGTCTHAAVAALGVAPVPVRLTDVEDALLGTPLDERDLDAAAQRAPAAATPIDDVHGSADLRRTVLTEMTRRALRKARDRVKEEPGAHTAA